MQGFQGLQNSHDRESSIITICQLYRERLIEDGAGRADPELCRVFRNHVPTLLRVSINCPHGDVRESFATLMQEVLKPLSMKIPPTLRYEPSTYVPASQVPPIDTDDEMVQKEFEAAFEADGRVSNMTRLMACHGKFLPRFRESHNQLMWDPGPLSIEHRHMIAIMASTRHQCQYLADIHRRHFLESGGPAEWLDGPEKLPPKMKSLLLLNQLMAHQPWLIKSRINIGELVQSGAENWSMNELVHVILIMAHFHALAAFCFGTGLSPELDFLQEHAPTTDASGAASSAPAGAPPAPSGGGSGGGSGSGGGGGEGGAAGGSEAGSSFVDTLKGRLKGMKAKKEEEPANEEANLQNFALTDDTDASESPEQQHIFQSASKPTPMYQHVGTSDADLLDGHVDFDVRSKEYSLFRMETFSWGDQGYATLSRYHPHLADLLEDEFREIKELSYGFIGGEEGIDTFKFRRCIWNYVLRMKGIMDEEYLYSEVNELLDRKVKSYIKTMACYPQLTTFGQWKSYLELLDTEKVHVCLLVMEARKQAELLYGLQAVLDYTK
jgi:sestrin